MLRVYLDQNKWVDLSRGFDPEEAEGAKFRDVALAVEAAVENGRASFPISVAHIFETWKRRKWQPRHALAATMTAISRNHAIAAPHALLPAELDRALNRRFGRPETVLPLGPFGRGLIHAAGPAATQLLDKSRAEVLAAMSHLDPAAATDELDALLLAGPSEDLPVAAIQQPPLEFGENFSREQNEQAQRFKQLNADKQTRRRAVAALTLIDIRVPTSEALARAGLTWPDLERLGADAVAARPAVALRRARTDVASVRRPRDGVEGERSQRHCYLSTAVGYCDVVVTERKWTHLLNVSGAAARFGTTVLRDLNDLKSILDDLGASP